MPPNNPYAFEVCVETAAGLSACNGLVDRVELCSGLELGGLTPPIGLMQAAQFSGLETHVLIRPRTGGFDYNADDLATMIADIATAKQLGLQGVVIGASRNGALDLDALDQMMAAAKGLDVTLHRVIDVVEDPLKALEQAIELGMTRILTSGGAATALAGIAGLAALQTCAEGRIEIMAGSGVNSSNAHAIAKQTGITAFHASCSTKTPLEGKLVDLNFGKARQQTDQQEVVAMRRAIDTLTT